jgi:hypothetical protein
MATRSEVHAAVDRLPEGDLDRVMLAMANMVEPAQDPVLEYLKTVPGIEVPEEWPPDFPRVDPITVEGEAVSVQLVRERR